MSSNISDTSRRSLPRSRPLHRLARAALDDAALIRADVGKVRRIERADLDELFGEPLGPPERPVCVDELDALPAVALISFEDRTDFDLDPGLLTDLASQGVLEPLT